MFKINKLVLINQYEEEYTYDFVSGVNYFKGKNASGKTEFYHFIDFMFGSSEKIINQWHIDNIDRTIMHIQFNNSTLKLERTKNIEINYFDYIDNSNHKPIGLQEYRDKLNSLFSQNNLMLKQIRKFTGEELTYRTFTMFNFLGEKRQGKIQDFLDKCSEIEYSVKINAILNFIFNSNLERISNLQDDLNKLLKEVKHLENVLSKSKYILEQVNENLKVLNGNVVYNGKNSNKIISYIDNVKQMNDDIKKNTSKDITELEVIHNNLSNQIKQYTQEITTTNNIYKQNQNRKQLIVQLNNLISENESYTYLVEPIKNVLDDIDDTLFFSSYVVQDRTINELKKQRNIVRDQLKRQESNFKTYSLNDKAKAIALIEEYLKTDEYVDDTLLNEKKNQIRKIKEEIRKLQNADNKEKIDQLSDYVTELYSSAKNKSKMIENDIDKKGIKIKYIKKGNILQPIIKKEVDSIDNDEPNSQDKDYTESNYYLGSMARHTLIQLCGYLGFLKILVSDNSYPIIPMLVIDHISKPFDTENKLAIGTIIEEAYEIIGKNNLQIIMFDDDEPELLSINPDKYENLINENKTGFNPYHVDLI